MTAAGGPGGPPTRPVGAPADHEGRGQTAVRAPGGIESPASGPHGGGPLDGFRVGDRKAMGRFVDLHADAVYGFILHRLDRPERVEDLVQEVFLAAWRALPEFRGDSEVRTWLLGIARHKIGDYYRDKLRDLAVADPVDEENPPASLKLVPRLDETLDRQKESSRTQRILSRLPDQYRAVLIWRYWDQRSLADMARITGNTEKAMERLLDRARRLFRKWWSDE